MEKPIRAGQPAADRFLHPLRRGLRLLRRGRPPGKGTSSIPDMSPLHLMSWDGCGTGAGPPRIGFSTPYAVACDFYGGLPGAPLVR
ncbi:hypothetical protein MAHJHV33_48290 [Mycobacterium avium subsp. hominissuis]